MEPLQVTLLGLFSALGAVAGILVVKVEASRKRWDEGVLFNGMMVTLLAAIAGARIYYVLVFNPSPYLANPLRIFAFHEGGLSIQGGLLGGIPGGLLYFRLTGASFLRAADTMAVGIILAQAIGRVGCDVFGIEVLSGVPWAARVDGRSLHPVQLYESMLNYLLFLVLWGVRDRTRRNGELFLFYVMGFAVNRFAVEFFRSNPQAWGPLSVAHVSSIVMVVVAAIALLVLRRCALPMDRAHQPPVSAASRLTAVALVAGAMVVSAVIYYLIYSR